MGATEESARIVHAVKIECLRDTANFVRAMAGSHRAIGGLLHFQAASTCEEIAKMIDDLAAEGMRRAP